MCIKLFTRYRKNWRTLRRAVNEFGEECENWCYEELDRYATKIPVVVRIVDGAKIEFGIELWEKKANGDLRISITADGLPTMLGVKPAYDFVKRMDGAVYYP